jgi:hypothetical protein
MKIHENSTKKARKLNLSRETILVVRTGMRAGALGNGDGRGPGAAAKDDTNVTEPTQGPTH